jgi:uncharacterized membrane protein
LVFGEERSLLADPKYALRLLVDIAIRALSPAVNDPTTAVQALDKIEVLLLELGKSRIDSGILKDGAGVVRFVYEATTWEAYLMLALQEIGQYGANSVQIQRRLGALLDSLERAVPDDRKPPLRHLIEEHASAIREMFIREKSRTIAAQSDRQGISRL